MFLMYKEELKEKHWIIVRKLNQNLTATLKQNMHQLEKKRRIL